MGTVYLARDSELDRSVAIKVLPPHSTSDPGAVARFLREAKALARSFRAWLKTVTHHAWRDFLDGRRRPGAGSGDTQVAEMLQTVQARDNLVEHLEEEFGRELLDEALARVRVQPHTWQAFHLLAFEGLSSAEAAARLNMKVATVFVARSKVQKMVHEEVRRLEGPAAAPGERRS
jgi:RNA polymerase sigma-70 factor (ECF subfamily)